MTVAGRNNILGSIPQDRGRDEEPDNSDEYGRCPNCGCQVHITDMGTENGQVCCCHCYQELRNN